MKPSLCFLLAGLGLLILVLLLAGEGYSTLAFLLLIAAIVAYNYLALRKDPE